MDCGGSADTRYHQDRHTTPGHRGSRLQIQWSRDTRLVPPAEGEVISLRANSMQEK
jgi:hypothetical protein